MIDAKGKLFLGIDIGGTMIRAAVVNEQGKIMSSGEEPGNASRGKNAVIESLLDCARRVVSQAKITFTDIAAVGLGVAGLSDPVSGVLYTSPNLTCLNNTPLGDIVHKGLGVITYVINDANAAAVGEMRFGAARGARNFIYLTLSTGIGGGIVINGRIYTGSTGVAGEPGHMVIQADGPPCTCGNRGCWETLASGTALAREAKRRINEGAGIKILEEAGGDIEKVTAETVHRAALAGDGLAAGLISDISIYLGVGFANLINLFNPEMIVIGGGLSKIGDMLLKPAFEEAGRRAFQPSFEAVRFVRAALGDSPGVVGAAAYTMERLSESSS